MAAGGIPRLGSIGLLRDDGVERIGASFQVSRPVPRDIRWSKDGWDILSNAQSSWLIVRGPSGPTDYEGALELCAQNLQKGLDLISANFGVHLVVSDFEDEQLVWWSTAKGLSVRHVSVGSMTFDASACLTVRDKDGNRVQAVPEPGPGWHESFRYYRLSQATTDLFDGYRNGYLALESVLSDIAPQQLKPSGAVAEGEGQWFRRALAAADAQYGLAQWVPTSTADPVSHLYQTLYRGTRSALSHAKSGRPVLLPQTVVERAKVLSSLKQLMVLYQGLAGALYGVRWTGGSLSSHAASAAVGAIFDGLEMYVSDDESDFDQSASALNPAGGQLVRLNADGPAVVNGNEGRQRWSIVASDLARLPFVRRIVGSRQGAAASVNVLADRLLLNGVHRFEAVMGVRILSARSPRSGFSY